MTEPETSNQTPDPLDPYRQAIREHGSGFAATLWASARWQRVRFDVLIDLVGAQHLTGATVLDLGCGDGALAVRLNERGLRVRRYIGVDGIFEQVQAGQARELERASFVCADLLESTQSLGRFNADVAFLSGTLNTMKQPQAIKLVETVFGCVSRAVVLNFLSNKPTASRRDAPLGPAERHDVTTWIDAALELTPLVAYRQDHMEGHDGALLLRHET